jgi:hypothetical protein
VESVPHLNKILIDADISLLAEAGLLMLASNIGIQATTNLMGQYMRYMICWQLTAVATRTIIGARTGISR